MDDEKARSDHIERIQGFRLIDDAYFNTFMEDNARDMELFLRVILKDSSLKVTSIQTQREVSNIFGRSVRFDVFTRNADGTICNTEVQRTDDEATAERARFNACMMDTLTVKKGFEWGKDHLPPTNVIFITENDPLRGGLPIYHIPRVIREMKNKRFEDNAQIIYVNASCQDETTELGRLMHDMFCKRSEDLYYRQLATRFDYLKTDKHGVMKMCKILDDVMNEGLDKGRAEGIAEATVKFVRNLLVGKDMSYEKIAKVADTSVDEVIRIANESGLAY